MIGEWRELKYIGKRHTPHGVQSLWDTERWCSPVDLAEMMGFQTAIVSAPTRDLRRQAEKACLRFVTDMAKRHGMSAPSATFLISDDGHIFTNVPKVQDGWAEEAAP